MPSQPPWHVTLSAAKRYAFLMRWEDLPERVLLGRVYEALEPRMLRARFKEVDRYGRELWRSPNADSNMRWVVDARREYDGPAIQQARLIWIGQSKPPTNLFAPGNR